MHLFKVYLAQAVTQAVSLRGRAAIGELIRSPRGHSAEKVGKVSRISTRCALSKSLIARLVRLGSLQVEFGRRRGVHMLLKSNGLQDVLGPVGRN